MKKITSALLMGAAIASCTSPAPQGYEISGSYADSIMDQKSLYLMKGDSIVDSTVVAGKDFSFKGDVDSAVVYRIAGKGMMRGQVRYNTLTRVVLQKGTQLDIKVTDRVELNDNGGDNQILSTFMKDFMTANQEVNEEYRALMERQAPQDSIAAFAESANEKLNGMWKDAVKKNLGTVAATAIFSDFSRMTEPVEFDSIYKQLKYTELFDNLQAQKQLFDNVAKTAEGKMFVDFEGQTMDGKAVKLSDYVGKGKYVLADFWASWCGPCRAEIPNLIKVSKKYSGKNFMVLGVDVWDKAEDFKQAVDELKINYEQMTTGQNNEATQLYGIQGIPHIILFAPDGTILKRGLRGEAITEAVKEALKK